MAASREVQEINASSMADIAFLLLIFFLVTTTMDVDTGIARQLPPISTENRPPIDINKRNLFLVKINDRDNLLVKNNPSDINQLKDMAKEFIKSDPNRSDLPTMKLTTIKGIKNQVLVPDGVISLQNDRGTTYGRYIEVQDKLVSAYNELRDEAALQYFGESKFDKLNEAQQEAIRTIYPLRISEAEPKNRGGND
jgi:biopolymer transport protein ExbD